MCIRDRNQSNLGFAKANNVGIRISTGTYLCLVNSDVRILDGCIDKLAHLMETRPDVGIAGPRMLNSAGITGRSCRGFPTIWNMFSNAVGFDLLFPRIRFFGCLLYTSDPTILDRLNLRAASVVVTVRPPASEAHYHLSLIHI